MSSVLRRGRLRATRRDVARFISSVEEDRRIAKSSVLVNEAHIIALARAGVIKRNDARSLLKALKEIEEAVLYRKDAEDIHVLIEEHVTKRLGARIGGRLHTGKSRNDQVATAIRMTLRRSLLELSLDLLQFGRELVKLGQRHRETVFPGYTHSQPAQPITFAHYLLAAEGALFRDNQRLMEAYSRINNSPMGSGALAGTSFPLDRRLVARLLGFEGLMENSLDAVSSRDFVLDALSVSTLISSDLSRLAQDLILYSSAGVGLVELPDEFSSTSSMMPHKKNPDPLELIRARCARVAGNLSSTLSILHALPTGYNLDFQEITPLLWDALDTTRDNLQLMTKLAPKIRPAQRVQEESQTGLTAATEIANTLVRDEEMAFRDAYWAVGQAVKLALKTSRALKDLTPKEWSQIINKNLKDKTRKHFAKAAVARHNIWLYKTRGSPHPREVERMLGRESYLLEAAERDSEKAIAKLDQATLDLHRAIRDL